MLKLRIGEIILSARNRCQLLLLGGLQTKMSCSLSIILFKHLTGGFITSAQIEHCMISSLHYFLFLLGHVCTVLFNHLQPTDLHLKKHLRIICVKLLDRYRELWVSGYSGCSTRELQILPIFAQNVEYNSVNH